MNYKQIDSGVKGPEVLLIAGVHGDEYEPMLATMDLLEELSGKLINGSVVIVHVVNETAYESASRYGSDGLDLARICPGNGIGSASEKAAAEISKLIHKVDYVVDMHTGGIMYEIFPMAGYMLHPSADILKKQQQMALAFDLPVIWGTDFRPNGRTLSIARDAGVPAIYLEYGGGSGIRTEVVNAYKNGFVKLLRSLEMMNCSEIVEANKDFFWVEDHRPDSGYFQGKMPSTSDGIFIAQVALGEMVAEGQIWGEVVNPINGTRQLIYADVAGLVFLIRKLVKVKVGDSLGGILPILKPGKKVIYE